MAALQGRVVKRLAQLEAAPPPVGGLSVRLLEVLRLVSLGRKNRDVAQVLAISPNTVANHMRNIFEKTYTSNRTEAAAYARSQGIA